MEKLLHERLRELENWCQLYERYNIREVSFTKLMESFTDEIERYYIPRQRFEGGEPVVKGSETDGGTVWSVGTRDDGYWQLFDEDGYELCYGEKGEFVKRPTLKVYDADGERIKVGDTVWFVHSKDKRVRTVEGIEPYDDEMCVVIDSMHYATRNITHREPDSLERIEDDATMLPYAYCLKHGIGLSAEPDIEEATIAMVRDLLRRQREALK